MLRGQKAEKMDALGCDERRGPGFASQSRRNFFTGAICQRCYSYARDWRAWAVLLSVLILLVAVMLYWCAKEYIHSVPTTLQPPQSFPFLSEEGKATLFRREREREREREMFTRFMHSQL